MTDDAAPRPLTDGPEDPTPADLERALLGRPASMGRREVSRGAGVSVRSARRFWHALGFPLVSEGDAMFTEADLVALQQVSELVRTDQADEDFALAMTRAMARTMDRLAVWQAQLVAEEVAEEMTAAGQLRTQDLDGDDADPVASLPVAEEAARRLATMADDLEPLLIYVWRRQLTAAINRSLTDAPEAQGIGVPRVVGFADLVNFTAVVRRLAEKDLAALVQRFELLATDIITAHGGRVVKTVGDEVMFLTPDVLPAAAIALDLCEAITDDDLLPEARVGMAYGPVINRLGDVFGTTVNRASRLTAAAPPDAVFVDDALARLLAPVSGFATVQARRRTLRGIGTVTPSRLLRVKGVRQRTDVTAHV
ncbi:adenylate/guanylate cyclase domain-containing protein [Marihabitans asiaticum]|uniref:Adenylate cyclase n=1 Tax=Marihabitans asiaticum TaxID=415218 RepID=A0A560WD00_9MICO|nr:adenylate/guanylate cyclase domain-containing protein [Marihabitans asiaticum]TWD15456.1 adenylate cyclase [Marihabitans asiaticum]